MTDKCDHSNYDEYFDQCIDCKLDGQEVHKEQCPKPDFKVVNNEDGDYDYHECQSCTYAYFDAEYAA
jgi:hypothetical protein